jgi:hypothetical protein
MRAFIEALPMSRASMMTVESFSAGDVDGRGGMATMK